MAKPTGLPFDDPPPTRSAAAGDEPVATPTPTPTPTPAPAPDDLAPEEPAPAGPRVGPPARRVLSVTELTTLIRDELEAEFHSIWVEGELSNCKVWNTGHLYFTLKDDRAQLRGFMFRSAVRYLRFKPTDGLHVIARGRISVYEPKGEYQMTCEHLEPRGLGALQLAYEQLKARLQREGIFDQARKRPLPALPRKIGVVTSLDGAAVRDILKVLARRHWNAHVVIGPARVQGEGAALEIARAIRAIVRVPGIDVLIVGRGGGSIEDLWAFNEEPVARAIADCPVPVISAVGHESDVTIADFAADQRAPTPSAAAEMVVAARDEFCARIDRLRDRLDGVARARIQTLSRRVHTLAARPALAGIPRRVAFRGRELSELSHALVRLARARLADRERQLVQLRRRLEAFDAGRRLGGMRSQLATAGGRLDAALVRRRHRAEAALRDAAARLDALSPLGVLGRGSAVAWDAARARALRDSAEVRQGDTVHVTLARGELECEVRRTR